MRRFKNMKAVYERDAETLRVLAQTPRTAEDEINFLKGWHMALQWVLGNLDYDYAEDYQHDVKEEEKA